MVLDSVFRLCFYGHLSDRSLFSRDKYEQYLEERIHRDPHNIIQPRFAAVSNLSMESKMRCMCFRLRVPGSEETAAK
jgi:hypothetical protein